MGALGGRLDAYRSALAGDGDLAVAVRRNLLSTAPSPGEVSYFVVNALAGAVVFAASVPVAYLTSPTAARITWLSLVPIAWLLSRYTARWRRTTDTA